MPEFKSVTKNEIYDYSVAANPSECCSTLVTILK